MNFFYIQNTQRRERRVFIGVDEVGVGSLSGPVTAAAVTGPEVFISHSKLLNLRDSKQLTPKQREEFFNIFYSDERMIWATAKVMPKTIDKINILQARKLAMERAVKKLLDSMDAAQSLVLIDGNLTLNLDSEQKSLIKGDERVPIIAAASIIAKVTRDRAMLRYHKKYPEYRFDLHKGYGTRLHYEMLKKHGPCPIHRRSFRLA